MVGLGAHTSPDVAAKAPLTLLLPVGSTEQHGPHLPLDTDTTLATAVADGVAARLDTVVVAPPITIGASGEHQGFAGTLSIGTRVLSDVIVEIVRSAGPEFARVVVINGHGGNAHALRAAAQVCEAEGRPLQIWSIRLPGADAHAGRTETSLMLAVAPDTVLLERAEPGAGEPLETLLPKMMEAGIAEVSANGVLGDPTGASADEGHGMLVALVDDAVAQVSRGGVARWSS